MTISVIDPATERVIASVEERGLDGEQAQIEAFYTVQKNK